MAEATPLDTEPDKSESETVFVCDCGDLARSACVKEPFYKETEDKRYCVLHYPGKEKASDFEKAFQRKIAAGDYNFRAVWFPDDLDFNGFNFRVKANFCDATFSAQADFGYATFSAETDFGYATFSLGAYFGYATFNAETDFGYVTFSAQANFRDTTFSAEAYFGYAIFTAQANFRDATFSAEADFSYAIFTAQAYFVNTIFSMQAYFHESTFSAQANFRAATFSAQAYFIKATFGAQANFDIAKFSAQAFFSYVTFGDEIKFSGKDSFGNQSSLDLQFARMETERLSFHTVMLRPHWFVNADPRKFVFTDVNWEWDIMSIEGEIESLKKNNVSSPYRLLAIACRQLAENAEGNNRYEEASRFRYLAMDLARQNKWQGKAFWKTDWLHMLYWAVSGYGERILRAFAWILAIWIVFALLYTKAGFTKPDVGDEPLPFKRAFTYSLAVMSLQKPEPRPLTNTAQTLVLLETILGPVQAALLALAIRRKFMR
jgi:hypothetical protein